MRTLKELKKYTLARYQAKAADDLRFRGVDQGAKIDHAISKGGDMRKTDPDIEKRSRKLDKRVIGIGKAGRKLAAGGYTGGVGPESPTGKMYNEELKLNEFEMETTERGKKFHYNLGKKQAAAGKEMGEVSDNYGPYGTHFEKGYRDHKQAMAKKKPAVNENKHKKKYLKDLKMTMNQATLGDMSTALQKGGFQGKGQYEETEILEDGHADVASAMRKCKTIMEDAGDIQTRLAMMGTTDSLPSWWTNKLAVAAAYMDSMRDYLLYPTMGEGMEKQRQIKSRMGKMDTSEMDPRLKLPKPKDKQMKLPLKEKHMTDGQMEKREKIVMAMKPKMKGFKDRYGDDAKNVMYATATKMAMKKEDTNLFEKVKKRKVNQKKLAGNDKFEADPTLTSQIMRPDNPSNDNDNKI